MYMNLYGVIFDLISKEEFNLILKERGITTNKVCNLLNIDEKRYFSLLDGKRDFSELEVLKLEKLLNTKILKKGWRC